ncbi:lytic transglycosylase F [Bacteroidia bacterium]|nr:lytic transglycosylase F [Bacteroidia bacterium]
MPRHQPILCTCLSALLALLLCTGCKKEPYLHYRDRMVVIVEPRMPGMIRIGDQMLGYQRELLGAYADKLGVRVEFVCCPPEHMTEMMRRKMADMALCTGSMPTGTSETVRPLCTSSYVALARKTVADKIIADNMPPAQAMRGGNIVVSEGFCSTESYRLLLHSLNGSNIFVSGDDAFHLVRQLSCHGCDFLICEKSEAIVGCALAGNLEVIHDFGESVPVCVRINRYRLANHFEAWLDHFRSTDDYAQLSDDFFEKGIVRQGVGQGANISYYDHIIRRICRQEGHDWRLLEAIAFSESRFHLFAVSPRGARGLMQVLPSVARHYNVDEEQIMDPDLNVMVAAKLLSDIRRSLRFAPGTSQQDRLSIILACYNAGLSRLIVARSVIAETGGNPDSWAEVADYLRSRGQAIALAEEGGAEGDAVEDVRPKSEWDEDFLTDRETETTQYVYKVLNKYSSYCRRAE